MTSSRSPRRTLFLLFLLFIGSSSTVLAQDPVYQFPVRQRRYDPNSLSTTRPVSSRRYSADSSTVRILPKADRLDPRTRLWNVNLTRRRPGQTSWTSRIVVANLVCFALQSFWPNFTSWGVKLSDRILQGQELYRLLTPVFLHGGLAHLFTNMYSLRKVGPDVEQLFGPGRFLASYVASGVAGNLLSAVQSPNPALGASGAVFGIVSSYYVFLTRNEWILGRSGRYMTDAITQTIAINMLLGALNPMVDNWGHLGGAIGGAAMAYWFGPRLFLLPLADGRTAVVDKPLLRLPRTLESLPETIVTRIKSIVPKSSWRSGPAEDAPWRRSQRSNYHHPRRMATPNRSIKPR